MSTLFSFGSPLSEVVLAALMDPQKADKFRSRNYDFYEGRIWIVLQRLNALDDEVHIIFDEITASRFPAHASLLLKMFIVTLDTMSDVFAWLISEVFDLGYDEKQISLPALLKNRHVVASGISSVIKSKSSSLNLSHFSRKRNDIVHRGLYIDQRLSDLEWKLLNHIASHLDEDIAQSAGYIDILQELTKYCAEKKVELQAYYATFIGFINSILAPLAKEAGARK